MSHREDEYATKCASQRLAPEDEEKLVQRLYYRQMDLAVQREEERQATLRRSVVQPQKRIPKAEEEELVRRMYDQQLQRFAQSRSEQQRMADVEAHRNDHTLSAAAVDDQVRRMYDEEVEKSRRRREELDKQYHPAKPSKKIAPKQLSECVNRLSHVDWAKRDEELFQKYVYPNDPKVAKISKADVEAMATRLSTNNS